MSLRVTILIPIAAVLLAAGCTDERVVFRDRDLLADLPANAQGFLGYSNAEAKLTVCGNCHIDPQTQWAGTAHADAWATLDANAGQQAFCEGCHTVSEQGNILTDTNAGWPATQDPRYHDVQCEACHGPGLEHVRNPGATQPLASLGVTIDANNGCGECHSGVHHPFVEEWAESGHGSVIASPAGRPECQGCHTGQGALVAFGAHDAEYVEKGSTTPLPIACGVCHDPHSATFDKQLRFPIDVPDEEQNLCMRCHHKRGLPDETSPSRGPHSPEGPLLLGDAGWVPPNMPLEPGTRIVGTHGTEANPRLCAGCHVYRYDVTDNSGNFVVSSVGHRFAATPCVDGNGAPTGAVDCTQAERSYASCTTAGCHGNQNAARSAHLVAETRLLTLADQLEALLAQVPPSEFSTTDNRYSTAEGAKFNMELARINGTEVHNPFLAEALLLASIVQVQEDYGLAPTQPMSLESRLTPPPSLLKLQSSD
jgi:predicted CXXCH cytochrome family protein